MSTGAHVCIVDKSAVSGSLVACTCGYALGPYQDHEKALTLAREHREIHSEERDRARQRKRRAATPDREGDRSP